MNGRRTKKGSEKETEKGISQRSCDEEHWTQGNHRELPT